MTTQYVNPNSTEVNSSNTSDNESITVPTDTFTPESKPAAVAVSAPVAAIVKYITPNFPNIPDELKQLKQWVLWAGVPVSGKDKLAKVPVNTRGGGVSSTNRKQWMAFETVCDAYHLAVGKGSFTVALSGQPPVTVPASQVGIGFVFDDCAPDADGYVYAGIDFDHVLDRDTGKIIHLADHIAALQARKYLKELNSYTEKSVSGDGLHVIIKAKPLSGGGVKFDGVECYTGRRYFTFTGDRIGDMPIRAADEVFNRLIAEKTATADKDDTPQSNPRTFELPEAFKRGKPFWQYMKEGREAAYAENAANAANAADTLGAGIESSGWFDGLADSEKLEVIKTAVASDAYTKGFTNANGKKVPSIGVEHGWQRLARMLAHTATKHPNLTDVLWQVLDDVSAKAAGYNHDDNERRWHRYINEAANNPNALNIGNLLREAQNSGADFSKWTFKDAAAAAAATSSAANFNNANLPIVVKQREKLRPGCFSAPAAIAMLNQHYLVSVGEADRGKIFSINDDGTLTHISKEDFQIAVAKISIGAKDKDGNSVGRPVHDYWIRHQQGNAKRVVFKPGTIASEDEYNEWRGFAVTRSARRDKVRGLIRHIYRHTCSRHKTNFKYLMKWCAWIFQHPDQHTEVAVMLLGERQGSGKSTVPQTLRKIIGGAHAMSVNKKGQLVGDFNEHLSRKILLQVEEAVWSGDRQAADSLKDLITSDVFSVHPKFRKARNEVNYLNILFCSNHDHAIALGINERRNFVLDVDESRVGDRAYWDSLYADLDNGGYGQFLDLLLRVNLKGWHPRDMPVTEATKNQMQLSGNSFVQWLQTSVEIGTVAGARAGLPALALGETHKTETLLSAYTNFCNERRMNVLGTKQFSQSLIKVCGPRANMKGSSGAKGYAVPDEQEIEAKIKELLGIKG